MQNISLRCTAGNLALAFVRGLEEETAIVAHVSQTCFQPHVEVARNTLRVRQSVNPLSFARQTERINTLVLAPHGLQRAEVSLKAGEVWLFGDLGAPPMQRVEASCFAGDVSLVDVVATTVGAHNKLGDVTFRWDDGGENPLPHVAVSGSTLLGDVRAAVAARAPGPSTPTWLKTPLPVRCVDPDNPRESGCGARLRWLRGTGRPFFAHE